MTTPDSGGAVGRRRLLQGGAAGLLGVGGVALGTTLAREDEPEAAAVEAPFGSERVAFHGEHQAGVSTPAQALVSFVGLDLRSAGSRDDLARLLRLWTDDAARLTDGRGALGDQEPELAADPSRLTVTVALGPRVFADLLPEIPGYAPALPDFATDALEPRWGQTDLLLQLGSDDSTTLAHARRVLTRTARGFAETAWRQDGFQHARGSRADGSTPRNLLGQVDGTVNPVSDSADFARTVWITDGPLAGGSHLVLRRIAMDLDAWEKVGRIRRERVLGRTLATGAPLTGGTEQDPLDLEARDPDGTPTIPLDAHVRRAHVVEPHERFLRRGYSYDDADGAGLLFAAYQADLQRQFVPVQRRLAASDALNTYTQAIGSATYTVLPGCRPGSTLGATLGLDV